MVKEGKTNLIYIGSDHAGYDLKEKIKKLLDKNKVKYNDLGTNSKKPVDYPDYAKKVARKVIDNNGSKGILVCGTGTGMVIAANKIKGVRAIQAYDTYSTKMSRKDNDANILCLRARKFSFNKNKKLVNVWLKTKFSNKQRHNKRIKKLDK